MLEQRRSTLSISDIFCSLLQDYRRYSNQMILPFVRRNSANSGERLNMDPSGIGGPNTGTSLDRETAKLKENRIIQDSEQCCIQWEG